MNAPEHGTRAGNRRLQAERRRRRGVAGRDADRGRRSPRRCDPAPLLQARDAPRRQLPLVHGRDQGRARARARPAAASRRAGMEVSSDSARAAALAEDDRRAAASPTCRSKVYKPDSELEQWRRALGVGTPRFARRAQPAPDLSHPAMAVNLDACIQCTRCVRACREEQVNDVIGYAYRGGAFEASCSTWTIPWASRPASRAANACRRARPARSRPRTTPTSRRSTRRWRRCARTAAWAASSPTTCTTTRSSASKAATVPRTTSGCA